MLAQPFSTRSVASRIIGWALLVFIVYGTTAEAAHRHGRVVSAQITNSSLAPIQDVDSSIRNQSNCSDCLICQLHQNFSATLISLRVDADASGAQTTLREFNPVSIEARVDAPRKDRAPPTVN